MPSSIMWPSYSECSSHLSQHIIIWKKYYFSTHEHVAFLMEYVRGSEKSQFIFCFFQKSTTYTTSKSLRLMFNYNVRWTTTTTKKQLGYIHCHQQHQQHQHGPIQGGVGVHSRHFSTSPWLLCQHDSTSLKSSFSSECYRLETVPLRVRQRDTNSSLS